MKTKRVFAIICAAIMLVTVLAACSKAEPAADNKTETKEQTALFSTPRERLSQEPQNSPEWVTKLDAAKNAKQLFVVAGYERSTAWISMHEKDADGSWKMIMSTPGFIGKEGLGKTKEGDGMTPVGTFHFNKAFGIISRYTAISHHRSDDIIGKQCLRSHYSRYDGYDNGDAHRLSVRISVLSQHQL